MSLRGAIMDKNSGLLEESVISKDEQKSKKQQTLNCWEFKKCGREPGGENVPEYGVCPASVYREADGFLGGKNAGRACTFVTGTFCDERFQGSYVEKEKNCAGCDFYRALKDEFGEQMSVLSFDSYIGGKVRDRQQKDTINYKSTKMDSLVRILCTNYFPFNKLSENRVQEVINLVRFVEMHKGEMFQIKESKSHNCLYMLKGSVDIIQSGSIKSHIGPADTKNRPMLLLAAPNTSTLIANEHSILCLADREMLDDIISWDDTFNTIEDVTVEIFERINLIRNSLIFRRLPYHCIESAFSRLHLKDVKKGENVISIGEEGDAYYIITEGRAEVFHMEDPSEGEMKIVELGPGDAFGEEALISGRKQKERVTMLENGSVLILRKDDFHELIRKPLVTSVNAKVARSMLESGYQLLDVRYREEYEEVNIPGTILIPLIELRDRIHELNPKSKYIIYCRSANRSKVAAMILNQNNFEEVVDLEGGIKKWPFEKQGLMVSD
jgi:rhodanese-related sulfurtransferase